MVSNPTCRSTKHGPLKLTFWTFVDKKTQLKIKDFGLYDYLKIVPKINLHLNFRSSLPIPLNLNWSEWNNRWMTNDISPDLTIGLIHWHLTSITLSMTIEYCHRSNYHSSIFVHVRAWSWPSNSKINHVSLLISHTYSFWQSNFTLHWPKKCRKMLIKKQITLIRL